MTKQNTVIITSISSDIGTELAKRYHKEGWNVIGTYRSTITLGSLKKITKHLYKCDLNNPEEIEAFSSDLKNQNHPWDLFISCAGTQRPICPFFQCDFDEWSKSIHINAIEQLRVLHSIYNLRNKERISTVIFFAGGGTNNAVLNYSAYTVSKIMLIKMCELIDFENHDLNVSIIGPGWTKTKMHLETLDAKPDLVGANYEKTVDFMKNKAGTSMDDIYGCIEFIIQEGKSIAGGRNFSVVHDMWHEDKKCNLVKELKTDNNMYKLRRYKNYFG